MIFCISDNEISSGNTFQKAFDNMCEKKSYCILSECYFYKAVKIQVELVKVEKK